MTDILIRGVNWVGDSVMSLPAIRAIRKLHPDSKIYLLVKENVAELFKWENSIDEIIFYKNGFSNKIKLINRLRQTHFSRAYLLQNAFGAALITKIAGIPEIVGYARDCRRLLLTHPLPYNKQDRAIHHIDYFFEIPKRFNPSLTPTYPWINPSLKDRITIREELKHFKRPVLAVAAGAKYGSTKKWEIEKYIEIVKRFTENYGSVIVLGASAEGLGVELPDVYDFTGKTTLSELICLISESDALLCNDSGAMHIGYAVGTPLVAIFGSTSPELTGPPKGTGKVIKANVECSPCFKTKCSHIKCMKTIGVDEVWEALKEILPYKKAVFFDRDGTLCKDANYLRRWEDFKIYPEIEALKELKKLGFLLIGVTNQSGIARGLIKEDFVKEVNKYFIENYEFDDFFYCPHHPDDKCFCRKPNPGMLIMARYKFNIDFKSSIVVGDKEIDVQLADMVGAKGILIGRDARNLKEVVEIIKRYG